MGCPKLVATVGTAIAGLFFLLGLTGCPGGQTGCKSDQECRGSRVCIEGRCEFAPDDDTGTDTGTEDPDTRPKHDPYQPDTFTPDTQSEDTGGDEDTALPDVPVIDTGTADTGMETDISRPSGPQIRVVPRNQVDFGTLVIGAQSTQSVDITNFGDEDLEVTDVELRAMPSSGFRVEGPAPPPTLSPGETVTYEVTFEPTQQAQYENHLDITSTDPDAEDADIGVTLEGTGFNKIDRPCLFSTPSNVDFGVVRPGNSSTETITIGNCSENDTVTVTEYQWNQNPNGRFSVTSNAPTPPFTLQTGDSRQIPVRFDSQSERSLTAELEIRSDEQTGARGDRISLEATGGGCPEANAQGQVPSDDHDHLRDGPVALPVAAGRNTVQFDGSESTAPSGMVDYDWSLIQKPSNSSQSLNGRNSETASLSPATAGIYEVTLAVSDAMSGQQGCTTDTVEVVAIDQTIDAEFVAEWQASHDLDIHVVRSDTQRTFPAFGHMTNDVSAEEIEQDWSTVGDRTDNVFHLGNAIPGATGDNSGSEKVLVPDLENDRNYRFALHFEAPSGFRPARFDSTVELTVGGNSQELTKRFTIRDRNKYWITYEIDGSNDDVTEVDRDQ